MKSKLNSTFRFRAGTFLLVISMLLTFGCKQANSPLDITSENGQTIEGLNINVKYAESYNETEITYSRVWPEGISAGFNKAKIPSDGELLLDYERIHKVVAFDEEGYMSSITEFLEGDGEINMPEEAYKKLKAFMPARQADYEPIVRIEMKDGITKSYTKSGDLKYENSYDPEEFRIDPVLLESLRTYEGDTSDVEQSVQSNIERLANDGINYDLIEKYYAKFEVPAPVDAQQNGKSTFRFVEDLRTGDIVNSAIIRDDGNYETVTLNKYKMVEGVSILSYSEQYAFGDLNGKWDVTHRTVTHRENINVIK